MFTATSSVSASASASASGNTLLEAIDNANNAAVIALQNTTPPTPPTPPEPLPPYTTSSDSVSLIMTLVDNPNNVSDKLTGLGRVKYIYNMGKYAVTIGNYVNFLNAIASISDPNRLFNDSMTTAENSSGISRTINSDETYLYTAIGPYGVTPLYADSPTERPITQVGLFQAFRFANWMANGQPRGLQDSTTTENGVYNMSTLRPGNNQRNLINPNTGLPPIFYLPNYDEWYKAAYYSQILNNGSGGYYKFATQSNEDPKNYISNTDENAANWYSDISLFLTNTQKSNIEPDQNYLTNIGAFVNSSSYYGTYDQTGNTYDVIENPSLTNFFVGGAWTSFNEQLTSYFNLDAGPLIQANGGFRLASPIRESQDISLHMLTIGNPKNPVDTQTNLGRVEYEYKISQCLITIGQYTQFLNAIAKTDTYNLYTESLKTDLMVAGISRQGTPGNYNYSLMANYGNSENRPITYLNWFKSARFVNWLANGQPKGNQDETTTENGSYNLMDNVGLSVSRNLINPNTGLKPTFFIPNTNELYKAQFYSPLLNNGSGGYFNYATQSNDRPQNIISKTNTNSANFVNNLEDGTLVFCITQKGELEYRNYLTDVGAFASTKSYYGLLDGCGLVSAISEETTPSNFFKVNGGVYYGGPQSLLKFVRANCYNNINLFSGNGLFLVST
jgi:formylglycine-generating enzyme required for sulfatase activity